MVFLPPREMGMEIESQACAEDSADLASGRDRALFEQPLLILPKRMKQTVEVRRSCLGWAFLSSDERHAGAVLALLIEGV